MTDETAHQPAEMWHTIYRRLVAALQSLDHASMRDGGITAWLQGLNYRGRRFEAGADPIAQFLANTCGAEHVYVSQSGGTAFHSECPVIPFSLPRSVADWITEFDMGRVPELVRERNEDERTIGQLPVNPCDCPTESAGIPEGVQQGD